MSEKAAIEQYQGRLRVQISELTVAIMAYHVIDVRGDNIAKSITAEGGN
jgi:hypothetical protein